MGGTLSSIEQQQSGDGDYNMLDKVIYDGFQSHLWLTLLSNVHLLNKFPLYMSCLNTDGSESESEDDSADDSEMDEDDRSEDAEYRNESDDHSSSSQISL